ncbi:osmolarity sensor protein [Anopheles sinensis]|uniref:Osmolarity sensor protein n=1 Tax=Anopheles sinensis TaxID=74873 RepID=A0A084W6Q6_ANOSI|nr:osmolarity sensor protein [Anopheles sinensis]
MDQRVDLLRRRDRELWKAVEEGPAIGDGASTDRATEAERPKDGETKVKPIFGSPNANLLGVLG